MSKVKSFIILYLIAKFVLVNYKTFLSFVIETDICLEIKLDLCEMAMRSHIFGFNYYLIYIILFLQFHNILDTKDLEDYAESKPEQVVVRAVFINCESNEDQGAYSDNEATRFQREELYKHSALQGCRKKLALTLKIVSEPVKSFGDEYIPIEHVFDGSNKKRVRLLDPYILRIRRESPLQAYKLRHIDNVSGIISKSGDSTSANAKKNRVQRDLTNEQEINGSENSVLTTSTEVEQPKEQCGLYTANIANSTEETVLNLNGSGLLEDVSGTVDQLNGISQHHRRSERDYMFVNTRAKRDICTANSPAWNREKRNVHNIIVEDSMDDDRGPLMPNIFYQKPNHAPSVNAIADNKRKFVYSDKDEYVRNKFTENDDPSHPRSSETKSSRKDYAHSIPLEEQVVPKESLEKTSNINNADYITHRNADTRNQFSDYDSTEKNFAIYDIGKPELWYKVHVQLFEKMSTPEGKTVWNDMTKGEIASVSSIAPEWIGQDVNVKYRPTEWISNDQFTLPVATDLCLLVPMHGDSFKSLNGNIDYGPYIVMHTNDIVDIEEDTKLKKRDGNYSEFAPESRRDEPSRRRVLIRASRALMSGTDDDMKILSQGSDRFLTLAHRRPHHAQIDLEARADENELIRVGSSASIISIVADNTRITRSTITVQASNKGLAAARFRVKTRDCGPELADLIDKSGGLLAAGPVMIAPRHTHRFRLQLPVEIPTDVAHCSVALINDEEVPVAVREVAIRKGDRCFCVWHCDCVCFNEEPKLLCREIAEARQAAAGLSPRERPRRARSACYPDVLTLNLCVVVIGVLITLLLIGVGKAIAGLFCRCVATWGLDILIQTPRKLDKYYECNLKSHRVVYDEEGWPVHPETKKRNVRLVSPLMEFALNVILFITLPSIMLWGAIKRLSCVVCNSQSNKRAGDAKKNYTHDLQVVKKRRRGRRRNLRDWMSPPADDLSTDLWSKGLSVQEHAQCEFMRPLLQERHYRADEMLSSCVDSEQDDTEYVLTQMQKSKESLARSQRKISDSGPSTVRKQLNSEVNY